MLLREVQVLLLATHGRVLHRRALELAVRSVDCATQHLGRRDGAAVDERADLEGRLCLAGCGSRELQGAREQVEKPRVVLGDLGHQLHQRVPLLVGSRRLLVGSRRSNRRFGQDLELHEAEGQLLLPGARVGRELVEQVAELLGPLLLLGQVDFALHAYRRASCRSTQFF